MTMHKYASKLLAPGFELNSPEGKPLSVCESAEWIAAADNGFILEIDHGEGVGRLVIEKVVPDPVDGMPIAYYEVDNELHLLIQSDRFKGVSPVIEVQSVNEQTNKFTKYRIDGISFQFEAAPVCPDSFCPTEYKGGDTVDKDAENIEEKDEEQTEETEEPPKVVKQKVVKKVKAPAAEAVEQVLESTGGETVTTAEYIAKLIRQNQEYENRLKAVEADMAARDEARRKELLESIPETHRDFAKDLESKALERVVEILNQERDSAKAEKDAATIVESGAVETTDSDNQKKTTEETKGTVEDDPEKKERDFFDKSNVFTVSEEKSGLFR